MESNLQKKALWQCRRGLKELDIFLLPFVENHFFDLNEAEQLSFMELLDNEDVVLMEWLINLTTPPQRLLEIINLVIKQHSGK